MKYLLSALVLTLVLSLPLTCYADDATLVKGMVVSIDELTSTVTVKESVTGAERTFVVARKDDLRNLKAGDQVNVTLDKANTDKVEKLTKE